LARSFDVPLDDLFGVEVSELSPLPLLEETLIGKTLDGRFRIVERIGVGGMGSVYKAVQLPMNRVVAVKVLERKEMGKPDPAFTKRFKLEAASTSRLRHPNTIQVFDHGCTRDGLLFIAMEYLEGQTLAELLTQHEYIAWPRALHIAQQICRSLREAHRLGLVHRDLKPANVMLLPRGAGAGPREGARLRAGQAVRPPFAPGGRSHHRARDDRRVASVHGAGAGHRHRRGPAQRHLRAGRGALRGALRQAPRSRPASTWRCCSSTSTTRRRPSPRSGQGWTSRSRSRRW